MSIETVPEEMNALVVPATGAPRELQQTPVPSPGPGEVLVRVAASPINPSDLLIMRGGFAETHVAQVVPLEDGALAPSLYANDMSRGKVLISTGAEELGLADASTKPVKTGARVPSRAAAAVI